MHILVVDDEPKTRAAVRVMLEDVGAEVREAADGAAALLAYRHRPADVVLCDLFMPQTEGLETIVSLRREFPTVKVIAMSGGGFNGIVDLLPVACHLGASGILYKPFDQTTLLRAIEQALLEPVKKVTLAAIGLSGHGE
jgi:CheY-like chemotaxis protein